MKYLGIIFVTLITLGCVNSALADQYIKGYTRSDGTQVRPHYRSSPDNQRNNNFSTQGNINPYTGQPGTKPRSSYEDNNNLGGYGQQNRHQNGYQNGYQNNNRYGNGY